MHFENKPFTPEQMAAVYQQMLRFPPEFSKMEPKPGPSILDAHALAPNVLIGFLGVVADVFQLPYLERRHQEMIAVAVSEANACRYCADSHRQLLVELAGEDVARDVYEGNWTSDALTLAEEGMLIYVEQLAVEAHAGVDEENHVQYLRELGWTDEQIQHMNLIVCVFSWMNRMAISAGLG